MTARAEVDGTRLMYVGGEWWKEREALTLQLQRIERQNASIVAGEVPADGPPVLEQEILCVTRALLTLVRVMYVEAHEVQEDEG